MSAEMTEDVIVNGVVDAKQPLQAANGKKSSAGQEQEDFRPPDGGWGWVVCFTSMWTNGTVFGVLNTFGIIYVAMRETYAKNDPDISFKTSWVGSVCTGITFLMCMVASIVSDRLGIRKTALFGGILCVAGLLSSAFVEELQLLYLTYGIVLGLGMAFTYSPSLVILGHYFKRHMGLVNGIVTFGSAVFTIVLSLVLPRLLAAVGLRYTLIMLGSLSSLLVVCAMTWRPVLRKQSSLPRLALSTESIAEHCTDCCTWTRKFLNVNIWKNKGYVVWAVSSGLSLFGYFVPFVHLIKHTNDIFPESDGSLLIMCMSITSGLGRIVFGKVADFAWVSRIRMQQVALAVLGITTMCIPFSASFGGLIAITLVMGICDGVFVCLIGPIAFDIVGPVGASQAIGFILGIFSLPMMVGPPVAGFLYDHLGSYKIAFHAAGAPPILGAAIMFFIPATTQNYPAVTEIEEFAAVSVGSILEGTSASDNREGKNSSSAEREMLVIKDTAMLTNLQETFDDSRKEPDRTTDGSETASNTEANLNKDADNS